MIHIKMSHTYILTAALIFLPDTDIHPNTQMSGVLVNGYKEISGKVRKDFICGRYMV